jgi:hypothetical protein
MISIWGEGEWGDGYWDDTDRNITEDGRNITEAESEWDSPIDFSPRSNTYRLVNTLLIAIDDVDIQLEKIYENQHINSASGESLDSFGRLINITRNTNESDDKYRARIKAAFRASTMGSTFDQFTEYVATVLNTDIENIIFRTPYTNNPAVVEVSAQQSVYDSVNLTDAEVRDLLERGVAAGHEVNIFTGGTFELKADGDGDDPSKGLTSDSISTGGTLAEDLI